MLGDAARHEVRCKGAGAELPSGASLPGMKRGAAGETSTMLSRQGIIPLIRRTRHRSTMETDPRTEIPPEWLEEFEAASRRPLRQRMRYAFIKTYRPVMDDEPFRAFDTMEEYRQWCEQNLPNWLGYGRV